MTPEIQAALRLVAEAASLAKLTANEHAAVQQALGKLEAALAPQEKAPTA